MKRGERMRGFTLLEVLVALTIAGMALGGLFAVIGGNKRMTWRSEDALVRTMETAGHTVVFSGLTAGLSLLSLLLFPQMRPEA